MELWKNYLSLVGLEFYVGKLEIYLNLLKLCKKQRFSCIRDK